MSKRVLLIKLTSMGDLMHALPALTDATRAFPGVQFDWVVDEGFAEVASWHPAVNQIIRSAHRRWRKNLWQSIFGGQLLDFYRQLNANDYDIVLDAQNNLKSAFITLLRRGKSHGLDKHSLSERPADWVYNYKHAADKSQHAISRQRQLMAKALGYAMPTTEPDFGIDRSRFIAAEIALPDITLSDKYLFFVHNASWSTKLWPETYWHTLINQAELAGYQVLLPCGNEEELQRAKRLAQGHANAVALPKLSLSKVGGILMGATGAVCCDTGLCHLAGMLDIPSVSFYGPTSDKLIGATGKNQEHFIAKSSDFPCAPCYGRRCTINGKNEEMSDCMNSFKPMKVWDHLTALISAR